MRILKVGLTAIAAMAMAAASAQTASAQSAGFAGTWAPNILQCVVDQSLQAAPMILTAKGYDQHETHCRFISVSRAGKDAWRVRARCSVEGDTQRHNFTIAVQGNNLTMRDSRGLRNFIKCG